MRALFGDVAVIAESLLVALSWNKTAKSVLAISSIT